MQLSTYIFFEGQCREAFELYQRVLGGEIVMMLPHRDTPAAASVPSDWQDKIIHARLVLDGGVLMASDAPPGRSDRVKGGYNVQVGVDDPAEAERIFHALAEGGSVTMPIAETFWARRFGMLVDRFGIPWMVNCESAQQATVPGAVEAFSISRTFPAPRTAVFAALTEPERMRQWWGPKGCTVIAANMDLRPGGTYHYGLRTPDGGSMWGKLVYREIVAPERIVLVNSFSDEAGGITRHPMSASWPLRMLSTFLLTEQGGRTIFSVTWVPLDATPEERATFDAARQSMTQGWTGTLDQLEAYLTKAQPV